MSYPLGFEVRPFWPDFAIWDKVERRYIHGWRHPAIGGTPTSFEKMLKVTNFQIRRGINSDAGDVIVTVQDHDNELVERVTGKSTIRIGSLCFFYFGRDPSGNPRQLWFEGEITEIGVQRPGTN